VCVCVNSQLSSDRVRRSQSSLIARWEWVKAETESEVSIFVSVFECEVCRLFL